MSETGVSQSTKLCTERMYLDPQIGYTRFLGRAFVALLQRFERLHPTTNIQLIAMIKKSLQNRNVFLENLLGDTWILMDKSGPRRVHLKNASIVVHRNIDFSAAVIASSVLPSNSGRAHELDLTGNILGAVLPITAEDNRFGMSRLSRLRDKLAQTDLKANRGYSHAMFAQVLEDSETGVKMTWVIDNYPYALDEEDLFHDYGGVRLGGLEHTSGRAHHSRVGIAYADETLFYDAVRSQMAAVGYPKNGVAFEAYDIEFSDGKLLAPKNPTRHDWPTLISESQYQEIHRPGQDPVEWYNKVSALAMNRMLEMMHEGVFFSWVDKGYYFYGGTYCSQLGELAWRQAVGVRWVKDPDYYAGTVRAFQGLGRLAERHGWERLGKLGPVKNASVLESLNEIIGVSGLIVQDHVRDFVQADFAYESLDKRMREQTLPRQVELSIKTSVLLEQFLDTQDDIEELYFEPQELMALRMRLVDYWVNIAAALDRNVGPISSSVMPVD